MSHGRELDDPESKPAKDSQSHEQSFFQFGNIRRKDTDGIRSK
jgi:hypothetical protein